MRKGQRLTADRIHPGMPSLVYPKEGSGQVPYPKPQMDWDTIRLAKRFCETGCPYGLEYWTGECRFKLLPNKTCFKWINIKEG